MAEIEKDIEDFIYKTLAIMNGMSEFNDKNKEHIIKIGNMLIDKYGLDN